MGNVEVGATCVFAGNVGNVKIGEINRFPVTLPGLAAVENTEAFEDGYPPESDVDLLERYIEKVSHPTASGNIYHYIEWAKEVSGVGDVRVIPLWNGNGTVKVVIVDSDNQPAGDDLIRKVKEHIEEQRPIDADVTVVNATALKINISVKLITDGSDGIQSAVEKFENPMIYNFIDKNMPEWAIPTVQKLVNKGLLKGNEKGLALTDDLLRILVINDRAGLYD